MKILLTFVGDRDPDYIDRETKEKIDGPILTLLSHHQYEVIELFYTPNRTGYVKVTIDAISKKYPSVTVNRQPIQISDLISHREILSELRRCNASIHKKYSFADYVIHVSPGTPQMHSAWLLLAGSGEISAKLLQTRDPKKIKEGQKPIEEIDQKSSWFPHIDVVKHDIKVSPTVSSVVIENAMQKVGFIGSPETKKNIENSDVAKAAQTEESILILGESGTGKDVLARFVHHLSPRRNQAFLDVNCAALPDNMIESELFGVEGGVYTGVKETKRGKFELADKGTLFLDEIGDMSLSAQAKILRAVQQKQFYRLGSSSSTPVDADVRIIAATNKNLKELMEKGYFREDLYFRLCVFSTTLPPLRENRRDIGILAEHFVTTLNEERGIQKILSQEAVERLTNYSWPNNIRELKNVVKRAHILTDGDTIGAHHLKFDTFVGMKKDEFKLPAFTLGFKLDDHLREYSETLIDKARNESKNDAEVARKLGISQSNLSRKKNKRKVSKS